MENDLAEAGIEQFMSEDVNPEVETSENSEELETSSNEQTETSELQKSDENSTEEKDESLEAQLNNFEEKKPEEESSDLLQLATAAGILRNGLPAEFKDSEHVKELISKGFDYTQKTQELSDTKKGFEDEMTEQRTKFDEEVSKFKEYETGIQNNLTENQVIFDVLKEIQNEEPDLIEAIEAKYDQRMNLYNQSINNPVVNELKQKYESLESQLKGRDEQNVQAQNENIVKEWETGLSDVQKGWGTKLNTLGIKANWAEVQKVWKADNSGNLTVKQALLAHHGEDIAKAMESKQKLAETKAKSNLRRGNTPTNTPAISDKPKSDIDLIMEIAEKHAS